MYNSFTFIKFGWDNKAPIWYVFLIVAIISGSLDLIIFTANYCKSLLLIAFCTTAWAPSPNFSPKSYISKKSAALPNYKDAGVSIDTKILIELSTITVGMSQLLLIFDGCNLLF